MEPTFLLSFKIWWSMTWRTYLASMGVILVFFALIFLVAMLMGVSLSTAGQPPAEMATLGGFAAVKMGVGFTLIFASYIFMYIVLLYIQYWAINRLATLTYASETKVRFMLRDAQVESFDPVDTVGVYFSLAWRGFFVIIGVFVISGLLMFVSTILAGLFCFVGVLLSGAVGVYWMLLTKKSGRYFVIEGAQKAD